MQFFCCRLLEMAKQEVGMTGALAEEYEHSKEGGGGGGVSGTRRHHLTEVWIQSRWTETVHVHACAAHVRDVHSGRPDVDALLPSSAC